MDSIDMSKATDAELAEAAAPPLRRNKYVRFVRGLLEGLGAVALAGIALTALAYSQGTLDGQETEDVAAARAQYEMLAARACPPAPQLSDRPRLAPPMERAGESRFGDTPPTAGQYDCLTQKLVDAQGAARGAPR